MISDFDCYMPDARRGFQPFTTVAVAVAVVDKGIFLKERTQIVSVYTCGYNILAYWIDCLSLASSTMSLSKA